MQNAVTIDVEDYFQVGAFEHHIDRNNWDKLECRVERNMQLLLEILQQANVKATFFMLGWIAERYPQLARAVVDNGHELASHGYGHQRVSDLHEAEFRADITKAKTILEQASGSEVRGYRAPSYSIGKNNLWALQVLAETGHSYNSSIYPIKHDHYGFPEAPRFMFRDKRSGMIEIPISTLELFQRRFPAGGGGFFRLFPYKLSSWAIRRLNEREQQACIFYVHPWEFDPQQPRQQGITARTKFRHYLNLTKTQNRFTRLLQDHQWGRVDEVFLQRQSIPEYALW